MSEAISIIYSYNDTANAVGMFWKRKYLQRRELILSAIACIGLVSLPLIRPGQASIGAMVLLGLWIFSFWIPRLREYLSLRREKLAAWRKLDAGRLTLALCDDGIVFSSALGQAKVAWQDVQELLIANDLWLLIWNDSQFSFLPVGQLPVDARNTIKERAQAFKVRSRCLPGGPT